MHGDTLNVIYKIRLYLGYGIYFSVFMYFFHVIHVCMFVVNEFWGNLY